MARLSKEKHLVLLVDDSQPDCLTIRLAHPESERLRFLGNTCDRDDVFFANREGEEGMQLPFEDMLSLDFMIPRRKGNEVLEWLQSQPFKGVVVLVLSASGGEVDVRQTYEEPEGLDLPGGTISGHSELIKLLEQIAAKR